MAVIPFQLMDGSTMEITGGTITGTDHHDNFRNNQDALDWGYVIDPYPAFVALTTDGCTNNLQGANELGSLFVIQLLKRGFLNWAQHYANEEWPTVLLEESENNAFLQLFAYANAMIKDLVSTYMGAPQQLESPEYHQQAWEFTKRFFLFTVNGIIVTRYLAVFFSIGDGVQIVNGSRTILNPTGNNKPPYLGYWAFKQHVKMDPILLRFQINQSIHFGMDEKLSRFDNFLIGTDGVNDLIENSEKRIPGTNELVGSISQFWTLDKFYKKEEAVTNRLRRINTPAVNPETKVLETGLLPDDTTFIAGRKVQT